MKQEEIQKYADKLAQEYFPNEHNIWARENIEAQFVAGACVRMAHIVAKHIEQKLIEKACEWLKENIDAYSYVSIRENSIPEIVLTEDFEHRFRKAMEE